MQIKEEIIGRLERLPAGMQQRVLDFMDTLLPSLPRGMPINELQRFAGLLEPEDANEMRAAIEEGCEQVNPNEW